MATEFSFDVVSRYDLTEVKNTLDQASKEIANRFDFRNSKTQIELEGEKIKVVSDDEFHLETVKDIIRGKFAKRQLSLKSWEYGKIEAAAGGTVRQFITLRQGIPTDEAKKIVKDLKAAGIKANAQIQGDQLRVTSASKDALQAVQKLINSKEDLPFDVEYINYR